MSNDLLIMCLQQNSSKFNSIVSIIIIIFYINNFRITHTIQPFFNYFFELLNEIQHFASQIMCIKFFNLFLFCYSLILYYQSCVLVTQQNYVNDKILKQNIILTEQKVLDIRCQYFFEDLVMFSPQYFVYLLILVKYKNFILF